MSNDKILDRVRKMMALANDSGATEAEREAALSHATALLQKHNLSMKDMPSEEAEGRLQSSVELTGDIWIRTLCNSIAGLFFCNYFYQKTRTQAREGHFFVGKESNAVTAMEMSVYLVKSIKREASKRYGSATSADGRSFCVGTLSSIRVRIQEMKQQGAKQDNGLSTGTSLVLADLYQTEKLANEKFLASQGVTVEIKKPRVSSVRSDSFSAGKTHGRTISLNRQVGGTSTSNKMIG